MQVSEIDTSGKKLSIEEVPLMIGSSVKILTSICAQIGSR